MGLFDFLEAPANAQEIVKLLSEDEVASIMETMTGDLSFRFKASEEGVQIQVTDRSPGGPSNSLREFEDRLIMYYSKGFEEVERTGQVTTPEMECQECMKILPSDSVRCSSCGSPNLLRGSIPESIVMARTVPLRDVSTEQFLGLLWKIMRDLTSLTTPK